VHSEHPINAKEQKIGGSFPLPPMDETLAEHCSCAELASFTSLPRKEE